MKEHINNFLKGFAIGAANVIPGVSGGTVALITNIFQRLVDSLKSFDLQALRLALRFKIKDFARHTDLVFLLVVLLGTGASILSFAKLLEWLFINYPIFVWSFFFGLILASVWFVGKSIDKLTAGVVLWFVIGTAVAVGVMYIKPTSANLSFGYLFLSGVIAICSMILPGLSGSYMLILLGVYQPVLKAVTELNLTILLPVGIGSVVGLLAFSHLLSWFYKNFKNQTLAVLTGFILGSLPILWPWKNFFDKSGNLISADKFGKLAISSNTDFFALEHHNFLPDINSIFFISLILAVLGFFSIWFMEKTVNQAVKDKQNQKL